MNETVNTFLLERGKSMLEMHLRQLRFTYSACGSFTRNKGRIQKIKEAGGSRYIYQKELDKTFFQHEIAYEDFKQLPRTAASEKLLRDRDLILLKIRSMMDISVGLLQ